MSKQQSPTVQQYYPNAPTTKAVVADSLTIIEHKISFQPRQLAYADSFCCDELCTMQFPENDMIGPFKLGGLGGYPFAGITGMKAFAGHIPDDGAALIFYGPHIGITKDGKAGEILRAGQEHYSDCCGSVSAALQWLSKNQTERDNIDTSDYQQNLIEQLLLAKQNHIDEADHPLPEAIRVVYAAIDKQIDFLISKTNFPCQYLIKAGGVFINGETDSFWAAECFECIDLKSNECIDWLPEFKQR